MEYAELDDLYGEMNGGKAKKAKKAKKTGSKKRPLNEYFKKMLAAKKSGAASFDYKTKEGVTKTYVRKVTKSPKSGAELIVYKAKGK
jgi:hypothetical protein